MARVTTQSGFPRTVEVDACGLGIIKKSTLKNVPVWAIEETFAPHMANHPEASRKGHAHWHSSVPAFPCLPQQICVGDYLTEACKCMNE